MASTEEPVPTEPVVEENTPEDVPLPADTDETMSDPGQKSFPRQATPTNLMIYLTNQMSCLRLCNHRITLLLVLKQHAFSAT